MAFGVRRTTWTLATILTVCLLAASRASVSRLVRRLGLKLKRAAPRQRSPDEKYAEKVAAIKAARAGSATVVFADAASLHRLPTLGRSYAKTGRKPPLVGGNAPDDTRAVWGAVDARTGQTYFLPTPRATAQYYLEFVARLLREIEGPVTLVVDNCIVHFCKDAKAFYGRHAGRLTVLALPTYAPFLNPVERIWGKMRREVTHNHPFPTMEELKKHLVGWIADTEGERESILHLTAGCLAKTAT